MPYSGPGAEPGCPAQVPGGMSAAYEVPPQQQQGVLQPQVPPPAASVHDSAATVQSVDFSKALQQAQAQAQVQGMGSQVTLANSQTPRPRLRFRGWDHR